MAKCLEEVRSKGTMIGPLTSEEVTARVGPSWIPMPRFCLETERAVDNGSVFGQNSTVGVPWKLTLGGIDEVASLAAMWLRAVKIDRRVCVRLSTGEVLVGWLHHAWSLEDVTSLVGRLGDMKSAYRQLASFPGHAFAAVVAAWDDEVGAPAFFLSRALLFGETAAVFGFNRVSRFLNMVACRGLHLVVSGYYDDFSQVEAQVLAPSAEAAFKRMFDVLGFDLSTEAHKDLRFSRVFEPLGVQIDLGRSHEGVVRLLPKPSRVQRVVEVCTEALVRDILPIASARSLAGVLRFLREGHFGRTGAVVLKALSDHVHMGVEKGLHPELREGLAWVVAYIPVAPPRVITASAGSVVSIFTDGAVDDERVTVGAVMFRHGSPPEVFGVVVPPEVEALWRSAKDEQVIAQAELVPVFLALLVWRAKLSGQYVIWWLDNDGARQNLINGYSGSTRSARIVDDTILLSSIMNTFSWYARVPTECNVADMASRLDWVKLEAVIPGAVRVEVDEFMWARVR